MPNINEFIGPKPEPIHKVELQRIIGDKPCSKCDKDVAEAYWDATTFTMSWTCPNGHKNFVRIN